MESEYSCELLNPKNVFKIVNKTLTIPLRNNGVADWPKNESKLVCVKEISAFVFSDAILPPLKSGESANVKLMDVNPNNPSSNKNSLFMNFNVKGTNYGQKINVLCKEPTEIRNNNNINDHIFNNFHQNRNYGKKEFTEEDRIAMVKRDLKDCYDEDLHKELWDYYYGYE